MNKMLTNNRQKIIVLSIVFLKKKNSENVGIFFDLVQSRSAISRSVSDPLHSDEDQDPLPGILDPDPTLNQTNSDFFLLFFCKMYNTHKYVFFL